MMGQLGTLSRLFVIFLVVLGTVDWTKGASLPKPGQANQTEELCKELAMKADGHPNISPKDGRCLAPQNVCNQDSDCCSGFCGAWYACSPANWCF